jgi:hypothetical protein
VSLVSLGVGLASTGAGAVRLLDDDGGGSVVAAPTTTIADASTPAVADPTGPTTTSTTTVAPARTTHCANTELGYALDYPTSWHTNALPGRPDTECRWFDPAPWEPGEGDAVPPVAVSIEAFAQSFEEAIASYDHPDIEVLAREDLMVGGARAARVDLRFLTDPDGTVAHVVIVEHRGLLALTTSSGSEDFDGAKSVLDAMAASLELS